MAAMRLVVLVALSLLHATSGYEPKNDPFLYKKFPDDFLWGTASAAYQVEGGWNASGKGESIWDRWTHEGGNTKDNSTGDVACNSYYQYKEDVQLVKAMGLDHYRFSIAWTRIFPDGTKGSVNQEGIDYYRNLSQELVDNGIKPMVTLYHWDLPQHLEEKGGWLNESIIGYFKDFADVCFKELGDLVPYWITFNQPYAICWQGYGSGLRAPAYSHQPGVYPYRCGHNVILAHAEAWHLYNDKYKPSQKGGVTITLNTEWFQPASTKQADKDAAEVTLQFKLGWFANPIYLNGDYPQVMKDKVASKSLAQGLDNSRLPVFTAEQTRRINGTFDFFGLNYYSSWLVSFKQPDNSSNASYENDQDRELLVDKNWRNISGASSWVKDEPWGMRELLNSIRVRYNNPKVVITENGVGDMTGTTEDDHRITYYNGYINNILKAIDDGCNVIGYTTWSLLDNFEWQKGYTEKFGLHYVNFSDPARPRAAKKSASWYKNLVAENGWSAPTTPTPIPTPSPTTTSSATGLRSLLGALPSVLICSVLFYHFLHT